MVEFLKKEKVDVVVACDMTRVEIVSFPLASRTERNRVIKLILYRKISTELQETQG